MASRVGDEFPFLLARLPDDLDLDRLALARSPGGMFVLPEGQVTAC
ncbi:MAG: hypothetical protein HIU82_03710 [Proteobacteria bacterium]|nr:hypothetical protein [Pseudomonadota bacterium]